tara:strand:- start:62 stop:175 length:114 start_codon:yes stop_codon:yes gene_type:complete
MYSIEQMKKVASGKTSLIVFACIVVVAVLANWLGLGS